MNVVRSFVRLPSAWIEQHGLKSFRWGPEVGASNIAALMILAVIAHHAEDATGVARITYNTFQRATSLSRTKIACGLRRLVELDLISAGQSGQSMYQLSNYDRARGWAKLPAKGMYRDGTISAFSDFHLRRRVELDALKLYFLFASRRDRKSNFAKISYEKIEEFSGVHRNYIKAALSMLAANGLVHIDHIGGITYEEGQHNAYRLVHLEPRRHMGTLDVDNRVDEWTQFS